MRSDLSAATVADVCEWVGSLGLDDYVATFQHHGIDGAQLAQLTDDHLRIELGISKIGHRARIRRERDALLSRSRGSGVIAIRQSAPAPPAAGSGRIKVSIRVGAAGQWVNIRVTPEELSLSLLRQRVASALNMDESTIERMQYRSGADWFAVLRDQDVIDCVADSGGDALVLQVGTGADDNKFADSEQLALVEASGGELSVVDSKQQVNLLWHGITWHQRLRALLARGEVQEALDALLEWHGARAAMAQSPAAVYNALLKLVNDTQLPSPVAVTAYELMRSRGVKPNAATYDHLLRALIRDGKPEIAARVLVSMDQTGHRPDSSAYNGIIQSLADRGGRGDLTMGLQIAAKGLEIEMIITVDTFNKLLAACARDGSTDEGVSAFKLLQKSGQTPDEESYASLLACTCMGSDVGLSMKAMQGMINAGYSPKMNLVNRVLGACSESDQATKVFKIVEDLQDVQLNSRSYAELMRCVRSEGNLELGVRTLKSALRAGVYLDGDVVGSIIDMAVESVDKAEHDRLETLARLQEQTAARERAETAQEESEQARLNALALAKANKDEATSWREQAAAAEDAAAEGAGSFDQFEAEWQWMETVSQDEVEQRADAVFTEKVAVDRHAQAEVLAADEIKLRLQAADRMEVAERAQLLSASNEHKALEETAAWRETALLAENAYEDLASSSFETPAVDWLWMDAAVQDEVSVRAREFAARQHADKVQSMAEDESRLATIAQAEAVAACEQHEHASLVAREQARSAKEETESWRGIAMAAEVAVAESLEANAVTVVDEWGFLESLMTDEAQAHAVMQVEYDTVMEKIGLAAASDTLSPDDAKALAQSEIDARLNAEKESQAAKETLAAAEIRWRVAIEAAEARALEAEKRMIAVEKRGSDSEKNMRDETARLQQQAERRMAESQSKLLDEAAKRELLEKRAAAETEARLNAETALRQRQAEVDAARSAAAQAEAEGARMVEEAHASALKAAEQGRFALHVI
jgi:pentatricopeptide repeat protein